MAGIRTKIIYVALPVMLFAVGILFIASVNSPDNTDLKELNTGLTRVSLDPPDKLAFAGEIVPMQDFEVKERLDRELVRNIYYHSSTIMNIKRAGRWKPVFMPILKENGIPEDFFYLAVAESQLSNVTSPAGAKGFWQFMPATAKLYDLEVSDEVDMRLDPIKSTHAACEYLKDANRSFHNWTLTAASYNMGVGGVSGQLKRQQVDNYYDLYLNHETSAYVFRILALKSILENPEDYGFQLNQNQLYKPLRYKTVEVDTTIENLVDFAIQLGTTYKMLKVLNPWILKDRLTIPKAKEGETQKSYTLHIPTDAQVKGLEDLRDQPADSAATGGDTLPPAPKKDSTVKPKAPPLPKDTAKKPQ